MSTSQIGMVFSPVLQQTTKKELTVSRGEKQLYIIGFGAVLTTDQNYLQHVHSKDEMTNFFSFLFVVSFQFVKQKSLCLFG